MVMVRKQLYLTQKLERELKKEAAKRGLSQAALIRERLWHTCSERSTPDREAARKRFLKVLRDAQREAKKYVGRESGWKFDREEGYKERLDRQMPR